jgi:hypothetical protein
MSVVLIILTIDTLAAISPGGSQVPPYTVINRHIDCQFDGNRGIDVPVIGRSEPLFGKPLDEMIRKLLNILLGLWLAHSAIFANPAGAMNNTKLGGYRSCLDRLCGMGATERPHGLAQQNKHHLRQHANRMLNDMLTAC